MYKSYCEVGIQTPGQNYQFPLFMHLRMDRLRITQRPVDAHCYHLTSVHLMSCRLLCSKHVLWLCLFFRFCMGKLHRRCATIHACFKQASAFVCVQQHLEKVDEWQIQATNSNQKPYRKLTLPCFIGTCFKPVIYLWPINTLDRKRVCGLTPNITGAYTDRLMQLFVSYFREIYWINELL